ncbi:hypothetical protein BDZ97DRAFT_1931131 [Flammula alnicola]|nr:hypothetical protein BDZ97DRAFT_1931131 [Flammula alnicola]
MTPVAQLHIAKFTFTFLAALWAMPYYLVNTEICQILVYLNSDPRLPTHLRELSYRLAAGALIGDGLASSSLPSLQETSYFIPRDGANLPVAVNPTLLWGASQDSLLPSDAVNPTFLWGASQDSLLPSEAISFNDPMIDIDHGTTDLEIGSDLGDLHGLPFHGGPSSINSVNGCDFTFGASTSTLFDFTFGNSTSTTVFGEQREGMVEQSDVAGSISMSVSGEQPEGTSEQPDAAIRPQELGARGGPSGRGGRGGRGGHGRRGGRRNKNGRKDKNGGGAGGGGGGGIPGDVPVANWDPDCNRGGFFFRQMAVEASAQQEVDIDQELASVKEIRKRPIPERQVLSATTSFLLSTLAAACRAVLAEPGAGGSSLFASATDILTSLVQKESWNQAASFRDNSLVSIGTRCCQAERLIMCAHFIIFLNQMHLRTKVESIHLRSTLSPHPLSRKKILEGLLSKMTDKKNIRTLQRWMKDGAAYCILAGAGSIYLLAIIACADVKSLLGKISADQVIRLATLIRCPTQDTPAGRLIVSDIIPAIAKLQSLFDINFTTMFSYDMLKEYRQPMTVQSADLASSDRFFDSIAFDCFVKPRDEVLWASCLQKFPSSIHPVQIEEYVINKNMLTASLSLPAPQFLPLSAVSMSSFPSSSPTRVGSFPPHSSPPPSFDPGSPLTDPEGDYNEEYQDNCSSPLRSSPLRSSPPRSSPGPPLNTDNEEENSDQPSIPCALPPAISAMSTGALDGNSNIFVIDTNFDGNLEKNHSMPLPRNSDAETRFEFTQRERERFRKHAVTPTSLEDLSIKLKKNLEMGQRKSSNDIIRITPKLLNGTILKIKDKNGDVVVVVDPTMPSGMRGRLPDRLSLTFSDDFKWTDTAAEGISNRFPTCHCDNYNRYSVQGDDADDNEEPVAYAREGNTRKYNTSQFIPRASKEMQKTPEQHRHLYEAFEDVLRWQSSELKSLLPDTYATLAKFSDTLPGNDHSPAYPFGGFVLNLNVATRVHRDHEDMDFCSIVVISDCVGGGLALCELGIWLDLDNGDCVMFRSSEITHFNMHFEGYRASFVFHSDRAADAWTKGRPGKVARNGWANNAYFRTT